MASPVSLSRYFESISEDQKFYYLIVIVASFWFFNTAYKPQLSFVVAVIVAVVYIYYHNDKTTGDVNELNQQLHYRLNTILRDEKKQPPKYFYREPDVINFFYSIRDYRIYNRDSYLKAVNATDNLLMIDENLSHDYVYTEKGKLEEWQNFGYIRADKQKTNIQNYRELFELAESLGTKAVNYMYSFVISLPSPIYQDKFQDSAERFHVIIKRILDGILRHCKKYSRDPMIGQTYGLPKPYHKQHEAVKRFNIV
jgi:hypothetical protein